MVDFKESIIIPLAVFKQLNFKDFVAQTEAEQAKNKHAEKKSPTDILHDTRLPVDTKMKLYAQQKKFYSEKRKKPYPVTLDTSNLLKSKPSVSKKSDISSITALFKDIDQPAVNSILETILEHPANISWDEKLQVVINGTTIVGSNLIDLLKYIRNDAVVTSESDIPPGIESFLQILLEIGVPRAWIKAPARKSRRNQVASWISYR